MEEENSQTIKCTVGSCKYNDYEEKICELEEIHVDPCNNCSDGKPEDESMCGSYEVKL